MFSTGTELLNVEKINIKVAETIFRDFNFTSIKKILLKVTFCSLKYPQIDLQTKQYT